MGYRGHWLHHRRDRWTRAQLSRRWARRTVARTAGRPKDGGSARTAILAAADALFYSRGIAPVSLATIAQTAGVTRRTLYYHFASKDDLVREYLKRRDVSSRALIGRASVGMPREAILAVFDGLDRWFRSRTFHGCALTNAVGERGDTLVIAGPITLKHKRALLDWFVRAAADAQAADPRLLGEQLMLLFDGALTAATTRRSRSPLLGQQSEDNDVTPKAWALSNGSQESAISSGVCAEPLASEKAMLDSVLTRATRRPE